MVSIRDTPCSTSSRCGTGSSRCGVECNSTRVQQLQQCRGCGEEFGLDTWIIPGGSGMVHNTASCHQQAEMNMSKQIAAEFAGQQAARRRAEAQALATDTDEGERGPSGRAVQPAPEPEAPPVQERRQPREGNLRVLQLMEGLSEARRAPRTSIADGAAGRYGSCGRGGFLALEPTLYLD